MGGTKRGRSKSPKPSPKLTAKKAATEDPDDAELKARYAAQLAKTKLMFMENRAQKMSVDIARSPDFRSAPRTLPETTLTCCATTLQRLLLSLRLPRCAWKVTKLSFALGER